MGLDQKDHFLHCLVFGPAHTFIQVECSSLWGWWGTLSETFLIIDSICGEVSRQLQLVRKFIQTIAP